MEKFLSLYINQSEIKSDMSHDIDTLLSDPKCLVVCNHSGGKDSQVMYLRLKNLVPAERLVVIHSNLGEMEWDGVKEHIYATVESRHEIIVTANEKKTFLSMVENRGMFPSPKYRQCTSDLKRDPIKKVVNRLTNERGFDKVLNCMGLRAAESSARSKRSPFKLVKANSNSKRTWYEWLPIHHLSTKQVFDEIFAAGEKPHWAYEAGMTRLSCSFCIMSSDKDICTAAKLRPELLEKIAGLEQKIGATMMMKQDAEGNYMTLDRIVNETNAQAATKPAWEQIEAFEAADEIPCDSDPSDEDEEQEEQAVSQEESGNQTQPGGEQLTLFSDNSDKVIISLFDYSGNWSRPYREAGYQVITLDIKTGQCIFDYVIPWAMDLHAEGIKVHGILAAVPCTEFTSAGAWTWKSKWTKPAIYQGKNVEFDNVVDEAVGMVLATLAVVELLDPEWWTIENPRGRIKELVPEIGPLAMTFQPHHYGDPYKKFTCLYGNFNTSLKRREVEPTEGSLTDRTNGSQKERRSVTPMGFARAFFNANP